MEIFEKNRALKSSTFKQNRPAANWILIQLDDISVDYKVCYIILVLSKATPNENCNG